MSLSSDRYEDLPEPFDGCDNKTPHPRKKRTTATTYKDAAKQSTLIFTLDLSQHGDSRLYALVRPMPRRIAMVEKARLLLAIGEWKCQVADGRKGLIRVRAGSTDDVRKTRRETFSFKGLSRLVDNIIFSGSPYEE